MAALRRCAREISNWCVAICKLRPLSHMALRLQVAIYARPDERPNGKGSQMNHATSRGVS